MKSMDFTWIFTWILPDEHAKHGIFSVFFGEKKEAADNG